jgi:hypothetical protein
VLPRVRARGDTVSALNRLAGWLRTRWQVATIPKRERCSSCTRRGDTHMTTASTVGRVHRVWEARWCDVCLGRAVRDGRITCKTCGRPFWPSFSHAACEPEVTP